MTEHQHVPDGPYGRADGLEYCGVGERSAASTERVVRAPKRPAARGTGHDARVLAPPSIVKRNTLLLAASQAFVGVGNQMVPTLGAIIVARLLGSAHLAGMATSALRVSRFLVSYPIGRVADLYGRRVAVVLGLLLGLAGAVSIGLSVLLGSFALFLAGILVFGAGVSAGYQLRVAAADMYPPSQRAQGLGYVLTGSLVGALGGPVLITAVDPRSLGHRAGYRTRASGSSRPEGDCGQPRAVLSRLLPSSRGGHERHGCDRRAPTTRRVPPPPSPCHCSLAPPSSFSACRRSEYSERPSWSPPSCSS
jgi:Major Facilitator Superfamily